MLDRSLQTSIKEACETLILFQMEEAISPTSLKVTGKSSSKFKLVVSMCVDALFSPMNTMKVIKRPCRRGGPMSPVWILKRLVSVFINACRLLSALPSLSQFGRGRLSLVAISFYALSLLFGPCRLSEFTLAGPLQELSLDSLSGNTVRNN